MHKEWCGDDCSLCGHNCVLDSEIPCSPDCEYLGSNGETDNDYCKNCDAIREN